MKFLLLMAALAAVIVGALWILTSAFMWSFNTFFGAFDIQHIDFTQSFAAIVLLSILSFFMKATLTVDKK